MAIFVVATLVLKERGKMMIYDVGLILEGGGMRGVYTAGVLDYLMDEGIWISHLYGVSAGAVNATNYLARQRGRTFRVTVDYINDKRYCSIRNLIKTGDLFGADFLYNQLPNKIDPFDYGMFLLSDSTMTAVVSDVKTGLPVYKQIDDLKKDMQWLRASCSLPLISRFVHINGENYLDGGITDSIPLEQSMREGNRKNIVILTQHDGYQKQPEGASTFISKLRYWRYPKTLAAGKTRHLKYNKQLEFIKTQKELGNVYVIQPKMPVDISRIEKDTLKLKKLYEQGYADAKLHSSEFLKFLGTEYND